MKFMTLFILLFFFSFEAYSEGYNPTHLFKKDQCTEWAKKYKERISKLNDSGLPPTLNIAFEGLGSYNERRTRNFYAKQQGLSGRAGSLARGGRGRLGRSNTEGVRRSGFFSRLKNRKSLRKNKLSGGSPFGFGALVKRFLKKVPKNTNAEYLVLPHTAYRGSLRRSSSKPKLLKCIRQFKNENPEVRINIIGHSFGGAAAKELEADLANIGNGLTPYSAITFDPRSRTRYSYVKYGCQSTRCINYYQKGFLPGAFIVQSPPRSVNYNIGNKYNHGGLPASSNAYKNFTRIALGYNQNLNRRRKARVPASIE